MNSARSRIRSVGAVFGLVACLITGLCSFAAAGDVIRAATFRADITPPLGHRCMGILPVRVQRIADPLEAIGVVLMGDDDPVVLVVLDWCELRNGAYDAWRERLAAEAGTAPARVLLSCGHQHDAPIADLEAAEILREAGLANELYDRDFHDAALDRTALALRAARDQLQPVTHVGLGRSIVQDVASNRRVQLPGGQVSFGRGSRSALDPVLRSAAVGEIDPELKTISLWNGDQPIVAISSYATHPMSHYGNGAVSADFVGLARRNREAALPGVTQIYASGCSGDVTAGKYNDGSELARTQLTGRMTAAMAEAWKSTVRHPLQTLSFRSVPLVLEYSPDPALSQESLTRVIADEQARVEDRIHAAMGLSSLRRVESGKHIDLPCLQLGPARVVLFPGESFVGLQLMAQQMLPSDFVMALGYGECWPGYIPTEAAIGDGFDGQHWQWVAPGSERRIREALRQILVPAPTGR